MFQVEMLLFLVVITFQQGLGDYLTLSTDEVEWGGNLRCKNMSWICTEKNDVADCRTSHINTMIDTSRLPSSFTAWIGVYIARAVTVVYEGCYETNFQRFCRTDSITCARECRYLGYYGIANGSSCVRDSDLLNSEPNEVQVPEHSCRKTKVYSIKDHAELSEDYCPLAYIYLSMVQVILEKCSGKQTFFCQRDDKGIRNSNLSWSNATKHCLAMSSQLAKLWDVQTPGTHFRYWLDGMTYYDYGSDERLPLFATRCAVLSAENGHYSINHVNCSSRHRSLQCHIQADETDGKDTSIPVPRTKSPTNPKTPTTPTTGSNPSSDSSAITSVHYTEPTQNPDATLFTTSNSTASTPKPDISVIVIPCAIGLVIIIGVAAFYISRKYRRSGYAATETRILSSPPSTPSHQADECETRGSRRSLEVTLAL